MNITPAIKPVILSQGHVSKALADPSFFEKLPEFRPLQAKLMAMHVDLTSNRGCGSCKKRRATANLFNDFMSVIMTLGPDTLERLKTYLGTPKLMVNIMNQGRVETRIL